MQYTHLPEATVVRAVKCLTYGCSVGATADICEVDERSVQRLLDRAGPRSEDFHQLQLEKLRHPPEVVELDALHAKVSRPPQSAGKKGGAEREAASETSPSSLLAGVVQRVVTGFTWRWR